MVLVELQRSEDWGNANEIKKSTQYNPQNSHKVKYDQ